MTISLARLATAFRCKLSRVGCAAPFLGTLGVGLKRTGKRFIRRHRWTLSRDFLDDGAHGTGRLLFLWTFDSQLIFWICIHTAFCFRSRAVTLRGLISIFVDSSHPR